MTSAYWMAMSGSTAAGIVLVAISVLTMVVVLALFLWAAREDGREQKRTDARVDRERDDR